VKPFTVISTIAIRAWHDRMGCGYFTGFSNGYPCFTNVFSSRVKLYKTKENAYRQMSRIEKRFVAESVKLETVQTDDIRVWAWI